MFDEKPKIEEVFESKMTDNDPTASILNKESALPSSFDDALTSEHHSNGQGVKAEDIDELEDSNEKPIPATTGTFDVPRTLPRDDKAEEVVFTNGDGQPHTPPVFSGIMGYQAGMVSDEKPRMNSAQTTQINGYSGQNGQADSPDVEIVGESKPFIFPTAGPSYHPTQPAGVPYHPTNPVYPPEGFQAPSTGAIDLTNDEFANRYALPAAAPPPTMGQPDSIDSLDLRDRRPVCIGSIDTQALILYPIAIMQKGALRDEMIEGGELRVDLGGEEWLKVKLKFRKGKGIGIQGTQEVGPDGRNGPMADTVINIMNARQSVVIGVVNAQMHAMFAPLMAKGLVRLEGYIKRGRLENMFTASLNIVLFTLPSNVGYIADFMANSAQFLDHPVPSYQAQSHFDHPAYYNPHNPPPEGFRAARRNRTDMMMGRGAVQQQKTIDVQRQQVDQVFMALPSHDELPETSPGEMIKTKLFVHQLKAITFLQQREQESSAVKAALAKKEEVEVVDVDAELNEEEKKKQIKKMKRKAEKDAKKRGVNSLWEPEFDGKKIKGWRHMVTEETVRAKEKPIEARGAILADEMGLGKTLSIVSLIASTLPSARKFAHASVKSGDSDDSSSGSDDDDLDADHFSSAVYGMAATADLSGGKKRKRAEGYKVGPNKIAKLERKYRQDRLQVRSRATLLICPLSTVSNWEEQIRDHWKGKVHVVGGGSSSVKEGKKVDKNALPEKGDLKVYVYHGNSRKNDLEFLADFDVVITTFSVLQTEYSKQCKTAVGEQAYLAGTTAKGNPSKKAAAPAQVATPGASDASMEDDDAMEVDGGKEKPEVRAERLAIQADGKKKHRGGDADTFGPKTTKEVVSPLQAVEWFRVVLDEAHFIKDPTTVVSRAACYLEAERRICLSGTPIQNKLDDIWALFKFLRLAPFDQRETWTKHVLDYAKAGNSLGVVRLQTILKHCTLRRTKDTTNDDGSKILDLPPRKEVIVTLELGEEERKVYDHHFQQGQRSFRESDDAGKVDVVNILQHILRLRQICDHPTLLESSSAEDLEEEIMADGFMDVDTAKASIERDGLNLRRALAYVGSIKAEEGACCASCQQVFNIADIVKEDPEADEMPAKGKGKKAKNKVNYPILLRCCHLYCQSCFKEHIFPDWPKGALNVGRTCGSCNRGIRLGRDVIEVSPGSTVLAEAAEGRARAKRRRKVTDDFVYSAKMIALLNDLMGNSVANPDSDNYDPLSADVAEMDESGQPVVTKSVVFSQWTSMLDLLEGMLEKSQIGCARLDGTMSREDRTEAMDRLKNDRKCEVLLVSLRAGGVGLNLVAASRCYLVDPYWNPAVEAQAIDRVHRMGQKRSVVATRYMIKDSIEEAMLKIQERKRELANMSLSQTLSKKELHERKINDLREIFKK